MSGFGAFSEQQRPPRLVRGCCNTSSDDWYSSPTQVDFKETETLMEWGELLPLPAEAADQTRLVAAVARGVPASLRPQVWLKYSGAADRIAEQPQAYSQLQERLEALGDEDEAARNIQEQIEKDLRRTDVRAENGKSIEGLRRVLCAYAMFNPSVSYVQGMNFIASGLLNVLSEEGAFWLLVLIVQSWLPNHFVESMSGNHIDCGVLDELMVERLPMLHAKLLHLEVSAQLLTARWFLCLWSSVLPSATLVRVWDLLFVCGPSCTFQAALACLHLIEAPLLAAEDMGTALAVAKERLRSCGDGDALVGMALQRESHVTAEDLEARRRRSRRRLEHEARRLDAVRKLQRVQRECGLAVQDIAHLARLCGGVDSRELEASWLDIGVGLKAFADILALLVPHWNPHSPFVERVFEVFLTSSSMPGLPNEPHASSPGAPNDVEASSLNGAREVGPRGLASSSNSHEPAGVGPSAIAADVPSALLGSPPASATVLSFVRLVSGLGWLLYGTSTRRAALCFHCFDRHGRGAVSREDFVTVLCGMYALHESLGDALTQSAQQRAVHAAQRIAEEATQFVDMMFELWDEEGVGSLSPQWFDRAAHQHPLLVQVFQLEQLDLPQEVAHHTGSKPHRANEASTRSRLKQPASQFVPTHRASASANPPTRGGSRAASSAAQVVSVQLREDYFANGT